MKLVMDSELFTEVIENGVLKAKFRIWIATANVKNLFIPQGRSKSLPLLSHFEKMQRNGVSIRILHGAKPSAPFRETLAEMIELQHGDGFEMQLCPRVHTKIIIIDNNLAYTGSANLTGAGLGAKSQKNRNFECGVITKDKEEISQLEYYFDSIWMGSNCETCGRRNLCNRPII